MAKPTPDLNSAILRELAKAGTASVRKWAAAMLKNREPARTRKAVRR